MASIPEIFETMAYGPAPEGAAPAHTWLDQHGLTVRHDLVRHFVRGRMQAEDFVP